MSRPASHPDPSMQSPKSPAAPVEPPVASRTVRPATIHNDNDREAAEGLHQHIRHGIAEGRATPLLIGVYFAAMVFFVGLVLYGLNHQGNESGQDTAAASAPAASTPAPAPETPQPQGASPQPSQPQQPPNAQQGAQQNAPAKTQPSQGQNQQQPNQQPSQQPKQPSGQQAPQPPAQQNAAPNAQQNAPAPKQ